MFEAAGIDAFTGLALICGTVLVGLLSALIHLLWQISLRTERFEWRGAVVSPAVVIGVLGALLFVTGNISSWAEAGLLCLLATGGRLVGALLGRLVGWAGKLLVSKASGSAYR